MDVPLYNISASGLIVCLIAFLCLRVVYQGLRNPLSHLPGPQISKFTSLVVTFYWFTGRKVNYVHDLHERYGPVVRVGPDEVDLCDISAAKEIHKIGGRFLKSQWYRTLVARGVENTFSTTDPVYHAAHRRLLASPLSDSSLTRVEPIVADNVQLAIDRIAEEMSARGVADVFKWWLFMATDIIGELSFGESFRMLELKEKNQYILDLEQLSSSHPIRTTFPFLIKISEIVPLPMFRTAAATAQRVGAYARQSIQRYKSLLAKNPSNPKPTLFTKLFDAGKDGLSDSAIQAEAQTYIVAGSDTTAITLTYLVYAVCQAGNERIKKMLVEEVASLPEGFTNRDLKNLPYLNQVIDETLRLYSAVPGGLPRVVPNEDDKAVALGGWMIPPGVTVTTQAFSLHRQEGIFVDADKFDPDRWASLTKEMKDAFMPWGGGSRICLGIHLARMELRLATALFFRKFPNARISEKEGMTDDDMQMKTYFLMFPKGHRCLVEA